MTPRLYEACMSRPLDTEHDREKLMRDQHSSLSMQLSAMSNHRAKRSRLHIRIDHRSATDDPMR